MYNWYKIAASGTITTVTGNGASGYSGDGGPATAAKLNQPFKVNADNAGNLFIVDGGEHVVRKISAAGIITTVAGTGAPGFGGDGGMATAAQLDAPEGVVSTPTGYLYISDTRNGRIRRIAGSGTGVSDISPASTQSLSVYPNPSNGIFSIKLSAKLKEDVLLTVADAAGRLVKEISLTPGKETKLQLNVPAGNYYLSAETSNGKIVDKIVVE